MFGRKSLHQGCRSCWRRLPLTILLPVYEASSDFKRSGSHPDTTASVLLSKWPVSARCTISVVLPSTTKHRTTTKFLSGPVGCQDFDESWPSTGVPFNIHLQQTAHSLFFCYFPSHTSSVGENALKDVCFTGELCFRVPEKKVLKTYEGLFFPIFLHTFCQKRTFCYLTTFFESPITHKRFIFKDSYISYGKRQKSCTLIVI